MSAGAPSAQAAVRLMAPVLMFLLLGAAWQLIAFNQRSILPPLDAVAADLGVNRNAGYNVQIWDSRGSRPVPVTA